MKKKHISYKNGKHSIYAPYKIKIIYNRQILGETIQFTNTIYMSKKEYEEYKKGDE